jgi:hypothetical protein
VYVFCRLLSLEAGGSLHLPKMMAIDFSGEDPTLPSLQQDEGYVPAFVWLWVGGACLAFRD